MGNFPMIQLYSYHAYGRNTVQHGFFPPSIQMDKKNRRKGRGKYPRLFPPAFFASASFPSSY
jgi:hypothetical protein